MTIVVKSEKENEISLPQWLMERLDLKEGDAVKPVIEGDSLRLTPLDRFLTLRGALQDDEDFDAALEELDQIWQAWRLPDIA